MQRIYLEKSHLFLFSLAVFKAAFRDYLYEECNKWIAINPNKKIMRSMKAKINSRKHTGFLSVGINTLKTDENLYS